MFYARLVAENLGTLDLAQFVDGRLPWLVLTAAMAVISELWYMTVVEAVWYKKGIRAVWKLRF